MISASAGSTALQPADACGQRGWRWQPCGGLIDRLWRKAVIRMMNALAPSLAQPRETNLRTLMAALLEENGSFYRYRYPRTGVSAIVFRLRL